MNITFKWAKKFNACEDGYTAVSDGLGGDDVYGMARPIPLSVVLKYAGIRNTFWCIRKLKLSPEQQKDLRLFAADCAERVLPIFEKKYPTDMRPRNAIQAARDFVGGKIDRAAAYAYANAASAAAYAYAYADADADAANAAAAAAAAAYAYADADAYAYAYAAARKSERDWQTEKLTAILLRWESIEVAA